MRAKKLFGITVVAREEPYLVAALPREELERFEEFIIEQARRRRRQDAWDIYYQNNWRHG